MHPLEEESVFDKLHEECGVFALYGHPEAANLVYLGLYALQHRGQESAGMASSDGRKIHSVRKMGHVADIFTPDVLNELPGDLAIGHTRYSTAGDTSLKNAQPLSVACSKGQVAVAHNGNLTNAIELRRELEEDGSIFQSTSDTEVVLHLVARSRERTLAGALRDALLQIEGAFSLVFLAQDRIIVARDPHGFRPLAMGRLEARKRRVRDGFCVRDMRFDLINATYIGDVEPGEMVIVGPEGMTREHYTTPAAPAHCVFEHVYFSRPDSIVFGKPVAESRERMGRLLARGASGGSGRGRTGSRLRSRCGDWLFGGIRDTLPSSADPESLRGTNVHRALPGDPRFRREVEVESSAPFT